MTRYIDADNLQETFKELHGGKRSLLIDTEPTADVVERSSYESMEHTVAKLNEALINSVEVVRCRDCKYMTEHYDVDGNAPYWTCSEWDSGTDYDGFCHYAERKEEDTDESVIAEWICLGHRMGYLKHPYSVDYKCSNCGHEEYTLLSPPPERCPNCRAYMKGKEDGM